MSHSPLFLWIFVSKSDLDFRWIVFLFFFLLNSCICFLMIWTFFWTKEGYFFWKSWLLFLCLKDFLIFYTKNLFVFSFFGRKNLVLVSLLAAFSTLHNKGVFAYNNIPFWYVSCGRCKIETSTAMVDFWHLFWSMHLVLLVTKVLVLFRFFVDNDFCCFWKSDSFPTFCNWYLLPFLFFCCWCYFDHFLTLHSCFSGFPLSV